MNDKPHKNLLTQTPSWHPNPNAHCVKGENGPWDIRDCHLTMRTACPHFSSHTRWWPILTRTKSSNSGISLSTPFQFMETTLYHSVLGLSDLSLLWDYQQNWYYCPCYLDYIALLLVDNLRTEDRLYTASLTLLQQSKKSNTKWTQKNPSHWICRLLTHFKNVPSFILLRFIGEQYKKIMQADMIRTELIIDFMFKELM